MADIASLELQQLQALMRWNASKSTALKVTSTNLPLLGKSQLSVFLMLPVKIPASIIIKILQALQLY